MTAVLPDNIIAEQDRNEPFCESKATSPDDSEKDGSERHAAEERKRLHPFFHLNQRAQRSSRDTFSLVSTSRLSAAGGSKNGEAAQRRSRNDLAEPTKPRPKKRKSNNKLDLDVPIEFGVDPTVGFANKVAPNETKPTSGRSDSLEAHGTQSPVLVVHMDCLEGENAAGSSQQPDDCIDEGGSPEFGTNESRRKRRKTTSPEAVQTSAIPTQVLATSTSTSSPPAGDEYSCFYLQLQAAAQGDLSAFDKGILVQASSPMSHSEPSLPAPLERLSTPSAQIIEISSDLIIPDTRRQIWDIRERRPVPLSSQLPQQAPTTKNEVTIQVAPLRQHPPPTKQLRINAKGKFSSPISKKSVPSDKTTQGRRSSRTRKSKRQKLAILKYNTGSDSSSSISSRIEGILSSPPRSYSARSSEQPKRDDQPPPPLNINPTKLAELTKKEDRPTPPPKPTHPFFKGKLGRYVDLKADKQALSTSRVATSGSDTERRSSISPRKGIPEKNANIAARPSGFDGFTRLGSSPSKSQFIKVPGALEPTWPPNGMVHVRGLKKVDTLENQVITHAPATPGNNTKNMRRGERKLKSTIVQVLESEDVVFTMSSRLNITSQQRPTLSASGLEEGHYRLPESLRVPKRILTTGREIQKHVRAEVKCRLPPAGHSAGRNLDDEDGDYPGILTNNKPHCALLSLYQSILMSSSPFDRAECETQSWVQKYAPQSAEEVLQSGREATILRDWLLRLQVVSVDTGGSETLKSRATHASAKRLAMANNARLKKKRKKRNDDLQGFLISSEEEDDEMEEITDPEDEDFSSSSGPSAKKSVIRVGASTGKLTNAVLISGPNGCGKTAAVYAVAKELGFEVFEVNAGSRRSGKDILEKVGDMTRNHLVHRRNEEQKGIAADGDLLRITEELQKDLGTGKQPKMKPFNGKDWPKANPLPKKRRSDEIPEKPSQPQQQKQSLILLEEVDILYEEDKPFWSTVTALIAQSKRPVIMTCNDETLLPLDTLSLHAELRFTPPPEDLAVDYLILLAAKEGHFINREALSGLYNAKHRDLRASIMELDYWCQIGIGDRKGGLEWVIQRWPPGTDVNEHGDNLRVASKDTYLTGMGWFGRDACQTFDEACSDDEEEILIEAWDSWQIDMEDWHERDDIQEWAAEVASIEKRSQLNRLISLNAYEAFLESISATDIYASQGMRTGNEVICDSSQPNISDKSRCDDIQGRQFLRAEPASHYGRLQTQMSACAKSLTKRVLRNETLDLNTETQIESLYEQDMVQNIIRLDEASRSRHRLCHAELSAPFSLLAASPTALISPQPTRTISSFDRTSALIATDLAPYVRTLVIRDMHLEEQRQKARRLYLQGGRNGRKPRTTRSAWSALDGGSRASKTMDKWLDRNVNHSLILRTGGEGWQEAAVGRGTHAEHDTVDDWRATGSCTTEDESMEESEH